MAVRDLAALVPAATRDRELLDRPAWADTPDRALPERPARAAMFPMRVRRSPTVEPPPTVAPTPADG